MHASLIFSVFIPNAGKYGKEKTPYLDTFTQGYDNLLVIGDLNIATLNKKKVNGSYFCGLCDPFYRNNFMTDITCVNFINWSSVGILLTNKIRSFPHTVAFVSGLRDCHKIVLTFFRAHFKKIDHENTEHADTEIL